MNQSYKMTQTQVQEFNSMYSRYKSHQIWDILRQIPNIVKSAYLHSTQSSHIKLQHVDQIQNLLVSNRTKCTFDCLLCKLTKVSKNMLKLYVIGDIKFNAMIIYYDYLWQQQNLPPISLHTSGTASFALNKWRKITMIIIYNPLSWIPFGDFARDHNMLDWYLNEMHKLQFEGVLYAQLRRHWIMYLLFQNHTQLNFKHQKSVNSAILRKGITIIIETIIKEGETTKLGQFLCRLKELDLLYMTFKKPYLLKEYWFGKHPVLEKKNFRCLLRIWLKYTVHDLDVRESEIFIESFYHFIYYPRFTPIIGRNLSKSWRRQFGEKLEILFVDYQLHSRQFEYLTRYWRSHYIEVCRKSLIPICLCES